MIRCRNNSTINSFVIDGPDGTTLSQPWSSSAAATIQSDGNGNVRVNGFNGLKSANKNPNTITINLTVDWGTAGAPSCGSPPSWTATAYTGNFSSTTFQLVDAADTNVNISSVPMALNCFTLTGLPASISAGTSNKTYPATLTNLNAAGGPSITAVSIGASTSGVSATASALSTPLAPGASVGVTVTVNTACGVSGGSWTASGTGSSSTTFAGATTSSSYSVAPCRLVIDPGPPTQVGLNTKITPSIEVSAQAGDGSALAWDGAVTWSLLPQYPAGPGSTNNAAPDATCVTTVTGGACSEYSYSGLKITSGTVGRSYQLNATTTLGGAVATTSVTFGTAFTLWGGTLDCSANKTGGTLSVLSDLAYVEPEYQGQWGVIRGENKGGPACIPVPYTLTVDTSAGASGGTQFGSFTIPPGTGQKIAVEYVVVWGRTTANTIDPNWMARRPKVSWGIASPVLGTDDYVPALPCVEDPADFSLVPWTGTSAYPALGTGLWGLLPYIPDVAPFNTSPHSQYQPGEKALICVSQHGWTSVGTNSSGQTLFQQWNKFIDQSDGFFTND